MRIVGLLLLLVACEARDRGPRWRPAGAADPREGGTLRFSTKDAVNTLDPALANDEVSLYAAHAVYDTLLDYDHDGIELVPRLAERWELAPDGVTYRFWLRDGIRFADGTPIRAADFEHAFERTLATKASSFVAVLTQVAGAQDVIDGKTRDCKGVTAHSERELEVKLATPNPGFRYVFAMVFTTPQWPGDGERPTSGPYRLVEWDRGQRLVFERNPHYHDRTRQRLERIVMLENIPRDVQFLMFERGELDAAERLSAPDLLWLLDQPAWQPYVEQRAQMVAYGMRMDVRTKPFDDVRVRRALNHALNKDSTVKLMTGRAVAAHGVLAPGMLGRDETVAPYPHDIARARALLREAGHGDGLVLDYVTIADEDAEKLAASMQADLAEVGVTVRISLMSFSTFVSALGKPGAPTFSFTGWAGESPDPTSYFDPVFHSRSIGTASNDTGYANPEVDRLLDEARAERDPERRAALYRRVDRIVHDDAPWLWNYHEQLTEVVQPYVRGPTLHPIWVRDYTGAWLDLGPDGEPVPR